MSQAYQFAIGRSRALILAGCFAAAALLLFFAGALSGLLYSNSREASRKLVVPEPVIKAPKAPEVKAPELAAVPSTDTKTAPSRDAASASSAAGSTGEATAPIAPSAKPASTPATSGSTGPVPATTPAATTATSAPAAVPPVNSASATATAAKSQTDDKPLPARVEASYAIPLAVRVGSFTIKSNAESLMQSLKDLGYQPAMGLYTDAKGRPWYVVKLGPYTKWNTASRVAARISIAENVTPVIGPMQ